MKSVSERALACLYTKMGVSTKVNGRRTSATAAVMKFSPTAQPTMDHTNKESRAARVSTNG